MRWLVLVLWLGTACAGGRAEARSGAAGHSESARVVRVVDGDTILAAVGTEPRARVRLIGINAPESVDPRREVECFGREASARAHELLDGQQVRLERDVSETDQYGRLLRYVWLDDVLVNEQLVAEGYAHVVTFPPDVRYLDRLRAAERAARTQGRGLWSAC